MFFNIDCVKSNCVNCYSYDNVKSDAFRNTVSGQNCCFYPWPKACGYFSLGVTEGLLKYNNSNLSSGFVFIDFSIHYLHFFTNARWVNYLVERKLKIIIVCDKYLKPLANYWFKRIEEIFLIIYHTESISDASDRLTKRFVYQRYVFFEGESLSSLEFEVLKALMAGISCHGLADSMNVNIRRVYAAKQRLENKMGSDVCSLFRLSNPA